MFCARGQRSCARRAVVGCSAPVAVTLAVVLVAGAARAEADGGIEVGATEDLARPRAAPGTADSPDGGAGGPELADGGERQSRAYATEVRSTPEQDVADLDGRATTTVRRADLVRRLPRSAPDALRYEPGVFVQQTAHGQGSPYIRGVTGQQTLILFDGIRLNNSTFRQGPNQYFFTLDSATLEEIAIVRGGASTRYGSDAMGGVVLARPMNPEADAHGARLRPTFSLRGSTADLEHGGRAQADVAVLPGELSLLVGAGARRVGALQSAGAVHSPVTGAPAEVPRFAEDGRTQLGTGFGEVTADARAVWKRSAHDEVTAAAYLYRQYDAPRTDQCPPPGARYDECLTYEQQFRTLAYVAYEAVKEDRAWPRVRGTLSYQQQHERRRGDRPASFVVNRGEDAVHSFGATAVAETAPAPTELGPVVVGVGAETYFDVLRSAASISFTDIDVAVQRSRGQYLDGSTYLYGGAFVTADAELSRTVRARAGSRISWVHARAPADAASGTTGVDESWFPLVGFAGVDVLPAEQVRLTVNLDRSFRAPNLDDLTSRQQTGPGFQFENARLSPELATTLEAGAQLRHRWVLVDVWVFQAWIDEAIVRQARQAHECPPNTPQCEASWSRFQLVNAPGTSVLRGVEFSARTRAWNGVSGSAMVAWTWGEGPRLGGGSSTGSPGPMEKTVPLSRVPPLNGAGELSWVSPLGFGFGAGVRWAAAQTRLAVADRSDARIPEGGTPGFVVVDARAWYQLSGRLRATLVGENLFDVAYRYHGSSVNGAGRGVILGVEVTPFSL